MTTLQERIAELMESTGWTVGRISEISGVSSSAVSQWKDGPTSTMKISPATRLALESGYSAMWLATGEGAKRAPTAGTQGGESAEYAGSMLNNMRPVPVVGTAKMGDDGYYDELSSIPGAGDGHIEIATDDPQSYGLRVKGQSMFPAIRDGWYVIVKPNGTPREGEYVLIKHLNGKKMVKEFLFRRSGSIEVMSVNGGERHTYDMADIEGIQAIAAVVPPSQWRPD